MKVTYNLTTLRTIIQDLQSLIPSRCVQKEHKLLTLDVKKECTYLSVSDGKASLRRRIDSDLEGDPFSFTLNPKDLKSILDKNKKEESISIEKNGTQVEVTLNYTKNPKFTLFLYDVIPSFNFNTQEDLSLPYLKFKEAIMTGSVSCNNNPGLNNYDLLYLVIKPLEVITCSTDGLRASIVKFNHDTGFEDSVGLNLKYVKVLEKQLGSVFSMWNPFDAILKDISIYIEDGRVTFYNSDLIFSIPMVRSDPQFLNLFSDLGNIMEGSKDIFSQERALEALESVSFFSENSNGAVVLEGKDSTLKFTAYSVDKGEASFEISLSDLASLKEPIAIKCAHFKDALKNLDNDCTMVVDESAVYFYGLTKGLEIFNILVPYTMN